ncbi:hypothetical protein LZ198_42075 [Myxococcus sp. K15C18031901]|uniref:hypothetical protein n=1 Tax=Myxococcus dinghuensis TaxID=2906761 RepID=UPI0020A794C1|nr:hypothetical protein [Myxococcus dinghuensis]MCP3105469.1 hypothetical protein [Myxococcus dinghuensis]
MQLEATFILNGGPEFGVNSGAPVHLSLRGGDDHAMLVRREEGDTPSDRGHLVRGLELGSDDALRAVWFGLHEEHRLLSGQLVRLNSNRMNPDYH